MPDIYQPSNAFDVLPPALGTNPFQSNEGMTGQNQGFSTGVEAARKNFEMAPLKKMEKQRQQMQLDRATQLQREFMSPEGIQSRTSAFGPITAANQLKQLQTQGDIEMEPTVHAAKLQEAQQHLAETKGKPAGLLMEELGNAADTINQAPEGMRPQLYQGIVQGIQSRYPGMEFPEEWKQYTPDTAAHLSILHEAAVNTPKQGQAERSENIKGRYGVMGQQVRGVEAAQIRQDYMNYLKMTGQLKENPGQELSRIRRSLANPKLKPEDRQGLQQELEMSVEPLIDDKLSKKYGNESNAMILERTSPGFMAQRQKLMDTERQQMRRSYGLQRSDGLVDVTDPSGRVGTIPREKLEAAKAKGYKEAK